MGDAGRLELHRWRIGAGAFAELRLPEPMTPEHVRYLRRYIEILEEQSQKARPPETIPE